MVKGHVKDIAYYMRVWRAERHLTQKEAAVGTGIQQVTWSRIERGKNAPGLVLLMKLVAATGMPLEALWTTAKVDRPDSSVS